MTVTGTKPHPIFLAGRWVDSPERLMVDDPAHPDTPAGETYSASAEQVEAAIAAAVDGFEVTRHLPAYERGAILRNVSAGLKARREEIGRLLAREAGKPIRDALVEVDRASLTFRLGAEEAERMVGETIPLDLMPSSRGRLGITRRFPVGPVAGISPFNFPLNLAAHKVAPALASGCSIVLKPPSKDPLVMLAVAELLEEAGAPAGAVSVLPMSRPMGDRLVEEPPLQGPELHRQPQRGLGHEGAGGQEEGRPGAGRQRRRDRRPRRRPGVRPSSGPWWGPTRMPARSASASSACSSHEAVWDEFLARFAEGASHLRVGDPLDPETEVGPMVDVAAARRTEAWVEEAVGMGGKVRLGGHANGAYFEPTILTDTPVTAKVCSNEAFAPLVVVFPFSDFGDAVRQVNDSFYGLQTGVFTNDLATPAGRSTTSRSAASSSTTSRATAPTTCPTAASRTPGSAARACGTPSRT